MKNALRWCAGFAALGLSSSVYSAALHADIDWYAGADLAIVHHEGVRSSETDWMSHKSWVGVDGSAKFTEKHRLLFVVEQEFSVQDSRLHSDSFGAGDHYLGVENSHGVLRLGSFDTALKVTVDEVDLFSDGPGDLEPLLSANAHGGNVIAYHTPEDQPWRVDVALLAGEGADAHAYAAGVSWRDGPVRADISAELGVADGGADIVRGMLQWRGADWSLSWLREVEDSSARRYATAGSFEMIFGRVGLRLQHIDSDIQTPGSHRSSVGIDYYQRKNLTIYSYAVRDVVARGAVSEHYFLIGLRYVIQ